jgi:oxygen-independent coproporphyrinogen-3 oxidase
MNLITKYNIAAPRYTSYPTVPYWGAAPTQEEWKNLVSTCFTKTNEKNGISLYIHLPYCERLCTYCACNTRITINHAVEKIYIQTLLKEWQLYLNTFVAKPRIKELHLGGGTPTFFSPENLDVLLSCIFKTSTVCPDAEFGFEAHPNYTSKAHLQTLFNLGFKRVSFGIQDFDPIVQEAINRIQTYNQVEEVVAQAREIGYTSINFDLIYGLPFQTKKGLAKTIEQVVQLKPDRIAFYSYAHVPWLKPGQRKFTEKDLPVDLEKRNLYEMGLNAFEKKGYKTIGMDHFALEGDELFHAQENKSIHRNFMGYTTSVTKLLIGLGASSISDTWNGFMQSLKTVETYKAAIDNNEFPIFKGHILSREDLILRKHILNIMCHGQTSWCNEIMKCSGLYAGLEKLKELERDGLVEIGVNQLKVTRLGQAFLRNICMCFDEYIGANHNKTSVFSASI